MEASTGRYIFISDSRLSLVLVMGEMVMFYDYLKNSGDVVTTHVIFATCDPYAGPR